MTATPSSIQTVRRFGYVHPTLKPSCSSMSSVACTSLTSISVSSRVLTPPSNFAGPFAVSTPFGPPFRTRRRSVVLRVDLPGPLKR